jgi:hypothetical protein
VPILLIVNSLPGSCKADEIQIMNKIFSGMPTAPSKNINLAIVYNNYLYKE